MIKTILKLQYVQYGQTTGNMYYCNIFQVTDSSINIVRTRKNKFELYHIQKELC